MIDLTSHCWCVAPWLTFVACAPAFGQDTAPLQTISPRARAAFAQSSPIPSDEQASEAARRISYGVETAFSSGHADRGFIMSDRPVVQPVLWLSRSGAEFSLWGNLTLAQTTDRSRPEILEMEPTREHKWSKLSVAPAVRMFFYHDALNRDNTRSVEGWLHLSYQAGPVLRRSRDRGRGACGTPGRDRKHRPALRVQHHRGPCGARRADPADLFAGQADHRSRILNA